jgi:hypothetical protein
MATKGTPITDAATPRVTHGPREGDGGAGVACHRGPAGVGANRPETKLCRGCGQTLPVTAFQLNGSRRRGELCRACERKDRSARRRASEGLGREHAELVQMAIGDLTHEPATLIDRRRDVRGAWWHSMRLADGRVQETGPWVY